MNTIHMQEINGVIYPTDYRSMEDFFEITKMQNVRADLFDIHAAKVIREGYKISIENSTIKPFDKTTCAGKKIGGEVRCSVNPCTKCYLNGLCDADECGRKLYKIHK